MTRFSFIVVGVVLLSLPAQAQTLPCPVGDTVCPQVNSWVQQDEIDQQQGALRNQQQQIDAIQQDLQSQERQQPYDGNPPPCILAGTC